MKKNILFLGVVATIVTAGILVFKTKKNKKDDADVSVDDEIDEEIDDEIIDDDIENDQIINNDNEIINDEN